MDEEVYFLDTRNDVRDHRVVRPGAIVPARAVAVTPVGPVAASSRVAYAAPPAYTTAPTVAFPPAYPQASLFGAPPVYGSGAYYGAPWTGQPWMGQLGQLFGGLNLGDVVKLAADAFAAFKSLPAAPVATGDVPTDVANMDLHLTALAKDAQTRKQIEYAGEIAGRFGRGFLGAW
jgi:hypothetical protein